MSECTLHPYFISMYNLDFQVFTYFNLVITYLINLYYKIYGILYN